MVEMFSTVIFYIIAAVTLLSGLLVISARNPVHSVFFLILSFFSAAGLLLMIGAEYLAMTLVIVYVGAVAVLFLFVVMMLDINIVELRQGFMKHLSIGITVATIIFAELLLAVYTSLGEEGSAGTPPAEAMASSEPAMTNTQALGVVLYTDYVYAFQVAGLILLLAMVGAIVLTHRRRPGVKRQEIARQVSRKRSDAIEVVKVKPGQAGQES